MYNSIKDYFRAPKSITGWMVAIFLCGILVIATYTRLWNLPGSLEFLGDQGRDALLVRKIFTEFDPVFIGPVTSVGNMYLGPLYYYFMLPFLILSYPSPVGPAYAVAVLGIITTFLVFHFGKKMVGIPTALMASALFATNAVFIQYSRFSWNPNPAPFAAMLMIYWTFLAWKQNYRYWLLVAVAFSILIQLHYITLISAAGAGIIFLMQLYETFKQKPLFAKKDSVNIPPSVGKLLLMIPLSIAIVLLSLTPLFLFDFKHGGLNVKAFQNLVIKEDNFKSTNTSVIGNLFMSLQETQGRSIHMIGELNFGFNRDLNTLLVGLFFITLLGILLNKKGFNTHYHGYIILCSFLFTGIFATAFYKGSLFNHYISYLFPIISLCWGVVLHTWYKTNKLAIIPIAIILGLYAGYNIPKWDLQTAGWSIYDIKRTSERIVADLDQDTSYTIVLLTGTGDLHGMNYRYYLTTLGYEPVGFERISDVEKLIIINEDQPDFDPSDTNIHEINVFPSTTPTIRYTIEDGPEIIILESNNL